MINTKILLLLLLLLLYFIIFLFIAGVVSENEESENADTSTALPLFNVHQRHNVTVPSISSIPRGMDPFFVFLIFQLLIMVGYNFFS